MIKRISKFLFPALLSFVLLLSAFVIVALLVAAAAPNPNAPSQAASNPNEGELVAQGRALFLAKGCLVCHRNDDLAAVRREMGDFDFGDVPNLSNVKIDAAYLKRWLHDPRAIKPSTTMPNLNLSDGEIDALAAYLTRDH
jgi:cytochrome c oxidase subunit 2